MYGSFDLEAVLTLPYAGDGPIYFKRKLSLYTILPYEHGICYTWDECNGKKGSSEIGTCLLRYIQSLPSNVESLILYSDTCGGQNRNKNALLYSVNTSSNRNSNLKTIDLKFMESGHSYLEADSVHATIDRVQTGKSLYVPNDYRLLMKMSRKHPSPYQVYELTHTEFYDLDSLSKDIIKNRNKSTTGATVKWLHVKWFRFQPGCTVGFKYDVDAEFQYMELFNESIQWDNILIPKK